MKGDPNRKGTTYLASLTPRLKFDIMQKEPDRRPCMKLCRKCKQELPVENFNRLASKADGLNPVCRQCANRRANKLVWKFNITEEEYDRLLEKQNGVCAVCERPEALIIRGKVVNLGVDHDHACCPGKRSCGKCVKGLLCSTCNGYVELCRRNPRLLKRLRKYIDQ